MPSGYTSGLAASLLYDAAVLYTGDGTKFAVSDGGINFTPENEVRHVQFDGLRSEIQGLHRFTAQGGLIEGTFLFTFEEVLLKLNPGMTSAAGTGNVDTVLTPKDSSVLWSDANYLANLRMLAVRGDEMVQVRFAAAYCLTWNWTTTDKNEQKAACQFRAVLASGTAATSTDTPPVVYEVLDSLS